MRSFLSPNTSQGGVVKRPHKRTLVRVAVDNYIDCLQALEWKKSKIAQFAVEVEEEAKRLQRLQDEIERVQKIPTQADPSIFTKQHTKDIAFDKTMTMLQTKLKWDDDMMQLHAPSKKDLDGE